MAEQPINSNEIIDPKFLDVAIQKAEEFLAIEKELEEQGKKNLLVQRERIAAFKGGTSNELKEQAKATAEATKELKNLEALKQAAAKTEIALANARAANERAQKAQIATEQAASKASQQATRDTQVATTAYDALRKKYNDLSRAQIELSVRGRENGVVFKSIKDEATKLRAELDKAEQGAGRFQRNVGNYASTFDGLGNSVSQLAREMPAFANSVQTGFMAISNNLPMFFDQLEKINKENAILIEQGKPTESVFKKLSGAIGSTSVLLSIGVTLLTVYGAKLITAIQEMFNYSEALDLNSEALKKHNDAVGKSIENQEELTKATAANNLQTLINTKQVTDTQGQLIDAISNFEDKRLEIEKRRKNDNIEIAKEQLRNGDKEIEILTKVENGKLILTNKKTKERLKLNEDGTKVILTQVRAYGQQVDNVKEEILQKSIDARAIQYDRELVDLENFYKSQVEKISTGEKNKTKEKIKNDKNYLDELERLRIENTRIDEQREIYKANYEYKINSERIKRDVKDIEVRNKILVELEIKLREELNSIKFKYSNERKDEWDKIAEEERQKELKAEEEFQKRLKILPVPKWEDTEEYKKWQKKKEQREKDLKETIDFSTKVIDIIAKEEAKKSQLRVDAYDKSIKDQEKNIETQRKLAEKGAQNTLVEEEANKVKLERQKEIEKQQEIKRQKALAFFKLFASYADKDPNTALQKALRDTVIAEAVSGAFIDGTENVERDLKGNKVHNGTDGYVIAVDGRERILNPEQNEKIGNLSNEALADLAYKHNNGLLESAKFGVMQSNSFADNIKNSALLMETVALRKEMQDIKQAIKSRPISNFQFDGYGDFIKTTIEDGFKKTTRYKQNKPRI